MANLARSLFDSFSAVYVIHLSHRKDRYHDLVREFRYVDYPLDKVRIFPAIKPDEALEFPSVGARGCYLSHLAVIKEARDQGLESILILEDDIGFCRWIKSERRDVAVALGQLSWDFVYFGHRLDRPLEGPGFHEWTDRVETTHFFGLRRAVYDEVIRFLEDALTRPAGDPRGGPMHVDGAYSTVRRLHPDWKTLVAWPCWGYQRPSPSDITGSSKLAHGFQFLVPGLRWIKARLLRWS